MGNEYIMHSDMGGQYVITTDGMSPIDSMAHKSPKEIERDIQAREEEQKKRARKMMTSYRFRDDDVPGGGTNNPIGDAALQDIKNEVADKVKRLVNLVVNDFISAMDKLSPREIINLNNKDVGVTISMGPKLDASRTYKMKFEVR